MINTICINTDGTVDCYDSDGCKVPHLCGDLRILHYIYKNYTAIHPGSEVLDEDRCERADFYIRNPLGNNNMKIDPIHVSRLLRYIKEE